MDDPLHLLAPGINATARLVAIREHLGSMGWRVRPVWGWLTALGWHNSFAAPWGVVYLDAATESVTVDVQARILAHEATHARQYERAGRLGRWLWGLRYLLSPWHRRAVEVEAESWEAACSGAHAGAGATKGAMLHHVSARALGGWRWPHLTGGDPDELRARVAALAAALLRRARGGGDGAPGEE